MGDSPREWRFVLGYAAGTVLLSVTLWLAGVPSYIGPSLVVVCAMALLACGPLLNGYAKRHGSGWAARVGGGLRDLEEARQALLGSTVGRWIMFANVLGLVLLAWLITVTAVPAYAAAPLVLSLWVLFPFEARLAERHGSR